MISEKKLKKIQNLLKKHHQGHLLAFWEQLDTAERQNLLSQIEQLDFSMIDQWVAQFVRDSASAPLPDNFSPAPCYGNRAKKEEEKIKYEKAQKLGKQLISDGKVAAFVVAGGQGTRLGFDGPKGDFPISPVKNKTLFQIFAETITAVSDKYHTTSPWYVMTSPLNYAATKETFHSNDYYSLDERNIFIFQQGTLPNFGFDGRILLTDKANIACSPDGHGGSLKALFKSGAIEDMKKRGVEYISYWQVDNPLVKIFDPLFIGLHAIDEAEMSSKALIKRQPKEKVGNFCLVDDKVTVIEYSDLPDELAEKKNPDGTLVFQLGSIAIHTINVGFVEKLNHKGFSLPLHRAEKKIPYIDESGRLIEPDEPNGIKLESFVFDALPLAKKSIILETERAEEFAPAKNATGIDSAQSSRKLTVERAAKWLESAGVTIPRKKDGSVDCVIEIAPSFALKPDDVKLRFDEVPEIKPGDKVYLS